MTLLAFDMGGSAVKYAIWDQDELKDKGKFTSPKTWPEMKSELLAVKDSLAKEYNLRGVAMSAPGAVNYQARKIEGVSALKYIHGIPIFDELEELFSLPVSIENDANSAALAEVWRGSAKDNNNVLFVVVGTGVGGSVIINREVQHGAHLFGGEFGLMLLNETQTFSDLATPVQMGWRYAERNNIPKDAIDGRRVFELAEAGDQIAIEEVDKFYYYLAIGLYNLTYSFDPEKIILGGGLSNKDGLIERIEVEFERILEQVDHDLFLPVIDLCTYKNDANLIGAVYNFQQQE